MTLNPSSKMPVKYAERGAPLLERLLSHVVETPTCWNWTGSTIAKGYGVIGHAGTRLLAHRVSWQEHRGPIPPGQRVLHKCDNRVCVNPDHLFLGTDQDNMDDMYAKGRDKPPKGSTNGRSKLEEDEIHKIRLLRGISNTHIGQIFDVTETTIRKIRARKLWKHI